MNKKNRGLTLIALIVSIIVILILAGVTISLLVGENGLINRLIKSNEATLTAKEKEEIKLAIGAALIDGNGILIDGHFRNEISRYDDLAPENLSGTNPWLYQGRKTYTIDKYGTVLEGIYSVWDGHSQEAPEIKQENTKFNWYIYTCGQLKFLEQFVNNGYTLTDEQKDLIQDIYTEEEIVLDEQSTVYLMSNLDFGARKINEVWKNDENKEREWMPIGKLLANKLVATFEGNNYIINGVYINAEVNTVGIFGYTKSLKNVTVQNSYIEGRIRTGGLAGYSEYLVNCHNVNTEVILKEGAYHTVGGVVGYFAGELLSTCTNYGNVEAKGKSASNNSQAGGIVGYVTNVATIEQCENYGEINALGNRVGGIAGQNNAISIKDCSNYGKIYSDGTYVGGISGMANEMKEIVRCKNYEIVEAKGQNIGGIAGSTAGTNSLKIEYCENNSKVIGGATVGGIVGYENSTVSIEKCDNNGNIESGGLTSNTSNTAGGIAGSGYGAIKECTNNAVILSYKGHRWNRAGGMVGFYRSKFR